MYQCVSVCVCGGGGALEFEIIHSTIIQIVYFRSSLLTKNSDVIVTSSSTFKPAAIVAHVTGTPDSDLDVSSSLVSLQVAARDVSRLACVKTVVNTSRTKC